jgi:glutamyl-tRNA synthetase
MTMLVRFAPSPTGYLHIGNARVALWNYLLARRAGGRFILRLDDTDLERSKPEFAAAIEEDLGWLGIAPDRLERQSERLDRYALAFEALKASGHLYPAYETPDELERKRKRQQARGKPPVYDRSALQLGDADRARLEAEGRKPHWRFKLSGNTVRWQDGVRGPAHIETAALSDPVLVRADGTVLYTFASVVDDAEMGVTHVLRGEDHVANTAVQIELFEALGAALPAFGHLNLIAAADGTEMSKRTGSLSIRSFRAAGIEPMAVASVAVLTGTSEPLHAVTTLDELAGLVDLAKVSRALTRFDPGEIAHLSARLVHEKPFTAVAEDLAALGMAGPVAEPFWQAVRGNLARVAEAADWWPVVAGTITPVVEDAAFLAGAATLLPHEPWSEATWHDWTEAVKRQTGRKGRALYMPLRLALTGRDQGPELKLLLPLIGRERALARLVPA